MILCTIEVGNVRQAHQGVERHDDDRLFARTQDGQESLLFLA